MIESSFVASKQENSEEFEAGKVFEARAQKPRVLHPPLALEVHRFRLSQITTLIQVL